MPYCRDCRDLSEWPERWMGEEKDLPVGNRLVQYFLTSSYTSPRPVCRKGPSKTTSTTFGFSVERSFVT